MLSFQRVCGGSWLPPQEQVHRCPGRDRANIFHDLHETWKVSLRRRCAHGAFGKEQSVDRIYDTFASEEEFREANEWIGGFGHARSLPLIQRVFLHLLGRELSEIATEDGILTSAFKSRVPIICLPLPTAHSVLQ